MSHQYHDWLLGEDSALRAFLPAAFPACSPQADAAAPRSLPGAGAAAPVLFGSNRSGKSYATRMWLEAMPESARIGIVVNGEWQIVSPSVAIRHICPSKSEEIP